MKRTLSGWLEYGNNYMSENWRVLPFQPILFTFLFIASATLLINDETYHPAFPGSVRFYLWASLGVICPVLAFVAWRLIKHHPGKARYRGFWIRLGADAGQFGSLTAFLIAQTGDIRTAADLYAAEIVIATWFFMILWIVRDVWKLVLTESVANRIETLKEEGKHDEVADIEQAAKDSESGNG